MCEQIVTANDSQGLATGMQILYFLPQLSSCTHLTMIEAIEFCSFAEVLCDAWCCKLMPHLTMVKVSLTPRFLKSMAL